MPLILLLFASVCRCRTAIGHFFFNPKNEPLREFVNSSPKITDFGAHFSEFQRGKVNFFDTPTS
jgi:hypothetical protein